MKLLPLFAVGLLVTVATVVAKPTATTASPDQCAKQDEGKTYGLPSDCHKYVTCKNGKLEVKSCSSKKNYDVVTSKCVKIAKATCAAEAAPEEPEPVPEEPQPVEPEETDEQYDYLCNNVLYGIKVHPHACDKYISCMKQKAKIDICAEGFIFSEVRIECVAGNKATCTATDGETNPTEPESGSQEGGSGSESGSSENENGSDSDEPSEEETPSDGYDHVCANVVLGNKPHPESCEKYISCSKQKAKENNCKDGYGYSSKYHFCVKEKNSDCAGSPEVPPATEEPSTTAPEVSEPSSEEVDEPEAPEEPETPSGEHDHVCANTLHGKKPHPHSCKKYISCSKHKAKVVNCKKGYGYSSKSHLCVKEKNSDCTGSPEVPPATEEPSTTAPEVSEPSSEEVDEPEVPEEPEAPSDGYDYVCAKTLLGNKPHPESCKKYISCSKHKAKEVNCKKGYGYSSKFHLCVKEKSSDCASSPEEPPATEEPSTNGTNGTTTSLPTVTTVTEPATQTSTVKTEPETTEAQTQTKPQQTTQAFSTTNEPATQTTRTTGSPPKTTEGEPDTTQALSTTELPPTTTEGEPNTTQALSTTELPPKTTEGEPATQTTRTTGSPPKTTEGEPDTTQAFSTTTAEPATQTTRTTGSPPKTTEGEPDTTQALSTTELPPTTTEGEPNTTQALSTTTAEPATQTTRATESPPKTTEGEPATQTTRTTGSPPKTTEGEPDTTQALSTTELPPKTTEGEPDTTQAFSTTTAEPATQTTRATESPPKTTEGEPATQTTRTTGSPPKTTEGEPDTTQALSTTTAEPATQTTRTTESPPKTTEGEPEVTPPSSGGDPQEPSCEGIASGYLAIEGNCTQYVYCQQGEPDLRDCLANYIFYEPFLACLPGNTATCELFGV